MRHYFKNGPLGTPTKFKENIVTHALSNVPRFFTAIAICARSCPRLYRMNGYIVNIILDKNLDIKIIYMYEIEINMKHINLNQDVYF